MKLHVSYFIVTVATTAVPPTPPPFEEFRQAQIYCKTLDQVGAYCGPERDRYRFPTRVGDEWCVSYAFGYGNFNYKPDHNFCLTLFRLGFRGKWKI